MPTRLIVLIVTVLLGLAPAPAALAHASLISSLPAEGAVASEPPERLILIFNEPVSPLRLQLIDPGGQATALTELTQHDATLIVAVPRDLGQGTHVLSWRVVSADGHPVGGTLTFSIGQADAAPPGVQIVSDPLVRTAIWAARFGIFVSIFFGVGGAVFAAWLAAAWPLPGKAGKIILAALVGGLVVLPLSASLQGLDALRAPVSSLGDITVWRVGFSTSYGTTVIIGMLALAFAISAMAARGQAIARVCSLAGLAGIGLALAASGHAATASPGWLTRPSVFAHLAAGVFWIGSLAPLAFVLRGDSEQVRRTLRRFSRAVPLAVVLLLVSGGALAIVQVVRLEALWATAYGWVLLAKLAGVTALFCLAAANRFLLTRRVEAGDATAKRWLRQSIAAEIVIALMILGVVSLWRFTPPPRSLVAAEHAPEFVHLHGDKVMADVTLDPGRVGRSTGEILVRGPNYEPMSAKEVTLVLSEPAGGIEAIRRRASKSKDEIWKVDDLLIPRPGIWRLRVEVLINDFEKLSIEDNIQINE